MTLIDTSRRQCAPAQPDIQPARMASREVWHAPQLHSLGIGFSEAAPGANLEGDFTS